MEASDDSGAWITVNIRGRMRLVEQMFLKIASYISSLHNEKYFQGLPLKLQKYFYFGFCNEEYYFFLRT